MQGGRIAGCLDFAARIIKEQGMEKWIGAALDYVPRWLEFQMRQSEQPGCVIAVGHKGKVILDLALGHADRRRDVALTPRHRFRVASHSKSFTAAGIMKLRERGKRDWTMRLASMWADSIPKSRASRSPSCCRTAPALCATAPIVADGLAANPLPMPRGCAPTYRAD